MPPTVAMIILTWNQRALTLACLADLATVLGPREDVCTIVVDNGSTDDTAASVRSWAPWATLLETGANLGYAAGNNVGIRYALAQGALYICILNNDVTIAPAFLEPMLEAYQESEAIGVISPLIAEAYREDCIWALGSAIDRTRGSVTRIGAGEAVSAWQTAKPFEVDAASGAAMLVKRAVFESVGLLDEDFYLYYEETDWCLRVRQAGYRILTVPTALVWHKVSATLGLNSPIVDYYMLRNHLRFIARHWTGTARRRILGRTVLDDLRTIAVYTVKPWGGRRLPHRNARVLALRDALLRQWGPMGPDVAAVCREYRP